MKPDYYSVLGVPPRASPAEIRQAYRALARRDHPDRRGAGDFPGEAAMAALNEAFETLGDRERRRRYDLLRRIPEPPEVLEAILGAARAALGPGIATPAGAGGDLVVRSRAGRASVRFAPFAGGDELAAWLRSAGSQASGGGSDAAVILACRVLDPEDARLRLGAVRFAAAAIDLIEARLFGRFPSDELAEVFSPFLGPEKQRA
jgi:curved DNA-binding protein CbpA